MNKLTKSRNKVLDGVCGGIAEYLNTDPTIIRILWFILTLPSFGTMLIAYVICTIIIPEDDGYIYQDEKSENHYRNTPLIMGIGLILLGVYLLAKIIYPQLIDLSRYWPVLLIILGIYILANYNKSK
ncbi:PspC domain-containing protein [Tissierella sp. Yu-01]|uniref:PspC domain-containing protein n=1 Tax=Tissierella sp. Yu-01 TaxID=3035694 RepID=UPI00240D0839|nr:PspC domain-containing protein [Tissierella sp. Yu-01]WFA09424.1 PspC domain-containing protein [Tissierella sp. Yu-01]